MAGLLRLAEVLQEEQRRVARRFDGIRRPKRNVRLRDVVPAIRPV